MIFTVYIENVNMRVQPVTSRAVFTRVQTPGQKIAELLNFVALKIDFKESRGENKIQHDIQHTLNYKSAQFQKKNSAVS
jgi:hypothetical protein